MKKRFGNHFLRVSLDGKSRTSGAPGQFHISLVLLIDGVFHNRFNPLSTRLRKVPVR